MKIENDDDVIQFSYHSFFYQLSADVTNFEFHWIESSTIKTT